MGSGMAAVGGQASELSVRVRVSWKPALRAEFCGLQLLYGVDESDNYGDPLLQQLEVPPHACSM